MLEETTLSIQFVWELTMCPADCQSSVIVKDGSVRQQEDAAVDVF